ncbi:pyrroline-5-carboxylate reductase [Flavobacterium sp. SM15]|uniref:pyrroline-5-carboxylate reductase n=1 Tax=Flavobacterium sp. SM15 TaxID=2908005 RepID=UPI001ED9D1F1|nr:pyrroline-5-carboxylate reductase [Flavobacterium sp. SM15]MCG2612507.1 pyrroline-5-carboxylate reductase [Flavobacterium sp. SM15]
MNERLKQGFLFGIDMKIAIVGYGNMGKTYAGSFIHSRFIKADDILVFTRSIPAEKETFGIPCGNFFTEISTKISEVDIVILSVKPQDFNLVSSNLKGFVTENQVLLSVMAGVKIQTIEKQMGCTKIVRSMPNIATQIGMGMTVFSASSDIDRKELFIVQNLINTTGKSVYVENESLIDAATAVSGSGPAYVFYFMNSMIEAAQQLGFSHSEAELLVNQTFIGAINLQNGSSLSNQEWITKVASKGGTTEKALEVFTSHETENVIGKAVMAANARALELGS